jgi:hypothetical protein
MMTDCVRNPRQHLARRLSSLTVVALSLPLIVPVASRFPLFSLTTEAGPELSRVAADSCARKVKKLQDFSASTGNLGHQTTRISEVELNSFMAYQLSSKYHPSLKSLTVRFRPAQLQCVAELDFDQLGMSSKKSMTTMLASLFSGTHNLAVSGKLVADAGQAHFELERALFDDVSLPNLLVGEIISTVGKRQKPPFDPMQPTGMPYGIRKVDVGQSFIVIYQ